MAGQEGKRQPGDANDEREHSRVDRLGHEQVRHTFDVRDDLPPLGDDGRHRAEVVIDQHQLRYTARRIGAGPHGDAEIGLLEGQHVVDAVPGHGHGMGAGAQGLHHGLLLPRRHTPEDVGVLQC